MILLKLNQMKVYMGIYTNPNLKGYGKILLETIIYFSFEILKVEKIFLKKFILKMKELSHCIKYMDLKVFIQNSK